MGRDLLTKLLDYVLEQDKGIDPRGFRLGHYKGYNKGKTDLQGLPGVDFDLKVEGDHIWLRVARLEAALPPVIPDARLKGIVVVSDDPNGPIPRIDDAALKRRLTLELQHHAEDSPAHEAQVRSSIDGALARYAPLWVAWAEGEKPRRKTIGLYGDLFAIKHQLESEETAKPHELVWGIGVAAWKLAYPERAGTTAVEFQYPLITQAVELALDERTLSIELRPRSVDPRVEFDAFAACQLPSTADVERAALLAMTKSADRPISPFDPGSFEHILKLIAGNLHDKGRYVQSTVAFPSAGEDLVVSDYWVILARPRSNNYLHEDIERLKQTLASGVDIPLGPLALVTPPSDEQVIYESVHFRGLSGGSTRSVAKGEAKELYFPLPYNHEQVTIVEQLEQATGVAVQGPPGTGKTHTIGNIVCHYLATGKKVLVTAKGEQALEVLQSKIPAEIRPLTVALLSGDREGMRQFQTSIEAIVHNVSQLNPQLVRSQIETQKTAIDRAHAELAAIDRRVNDIALSQLSSVEVDGVALRAQKMAELVLSGAEQHSWFDDAISLDHVNSPPLTAAEGAKLREARRRLGADLIYSLATVPSSAALLPAAEVGRLHQILVDLKKIEAAETKGGLLALRATTPEVLANARNLLTAVEAAASLARELEATGQVWTAAVRQKCLQPTFASERHALEALFGEMDLLIQERAEFLKRPVEIPESAIQEPKVVEAATRGAESGKPYGFVSFTARAVKDQVRAIRVAGLPPSDQGDWQHVQRYMRLHEKVLSFSARWNEIAELLSAPTVSGGVPALRQIELVSTNARKAHRLATKYDESLPDLADRVFAKPPIRELRGTSAQLDAVRHQLRMHLTRADLARAAVLLATIQEKLAGTSGPISVKLRTFVEKDLGNQVVPVERMVARYAEQVSEIRRIEDLAHDLGTVNEMASRLEKSGAPKLAMRVRSNPAGPTGEDSAFPVTWREAWNWARIRTHLETIEGREELQTLAARRRDLEKGLAKLYESMVSKSAWLATKMAASPKVLSCPRDLSNGGSPHWYGDGPKCDATQARRPEGYERRTGSGSLLGHESCQSL